MSNYITKADYLHKIRLPRLEMMIEEDNSILDDAEETAVAVVKDALHAHYDNEAIFTKTGDDRDKQVVRWVMNLAVYYIYERIPDKLVPERVVKNYDDTILTLMEIADRKKSVDLPKITNADGVTATKFRCGGIEPRSY